MLVIDLPTDVLCKLYEFVALPFVLKLVSRTLRVAGPKTTETRLSEVVRTSWRFRWAYRVGCPFEWNAQLASKMARHGALGALLWAHRNGMPWDHRTCEQAGKFGHLETLKVAAINGCDMDVSAVANCAACHGQIHVLGWIQDNYKTPLNEWTCIGAARYGQLATLKWLRAHSCEWNVWCIVNAAIGGHLKLIQWARANGCKWNRMAVMWAARNGHMDVLVWLCESGCNWDERACMYAARGGHLEVLEWLRGGPCGVCPWKSETCWAAAMSGHLNVLKWLIANDCPTCWTTWAGAALAGHVHVLRWLRSQGWSRDDAINYCSYAKAHPKTMRWIKTMHRWDLVRSEVTSWKCT